MRLLLKKRLEEKVLLQGITTEIDQKRKQIPENKISKRIRTQDVIALGEKYIDTNCFAICKKYVTYKRDLKTEGLWTSLQFIKDMIYNIKKNDPVIL